MTWWPESWSAILMPDAPVAELLVRGTAIYWFLYALMRVTGRRLLGQFSMSDILVVLLIAVSVRDGLTGPFHTVGDAVISGAVILGWNRFIDRIAYHVPAVGNLLRHQPKALVREGRLVEETARDHLLTPPEILQKLRRHGVRSYDEVDVAFMEQDGSVTVVRRRGGVAPGS